MTAAWATLDANQQAALACMLTCCVGLCLGAIWALRVSGRRTITDDLDVQEYADAAADRADAALIEWNQQAWAEIDGAS